MASYTQEIVKSPRNVQHTSTPTSAGSSLAKHVRRMTINIMEDNTAAAPSRGSWAASASGGGGCSEPKFTEVTKWLSLADNVLTVLDARSNTERSHGRRNSESYTRICMDQISDILDYGDFGSHHVPFSIKGCITIITSEQKKFFFHFGDDQRTKTAWLIAFNASIDNVLFQKSLYTSQPIIELPAAMKFKFKKKFDKLFSLYRSIRDEDAVIVFNESILPTAAEPRSSSSSSLSSPSASSMAACLNPVDLTRYVQYEFQRRKDVKLRSLFTELSQYFVKNYTPRLLESEQLDADSVKIVHPLAVVDSCQPIPKAPPLPPLPADKVVIQSHVKMKQIFWHKIKPINVMNTIWMSLPPPAECRWKTIEEKFGDKELLRRRAIVKQPQEAAALTDTAATPLKKVNLFDARRTQNVAIACARLKKTPFEIYEIVLQMDPVDLSFETAEVILNLLLPSADEAACLRAYTGDVEQLDFCGQLFSYFSQIEALESRLVVQKIMLSWSDEATCALQLLKVVQLSLEELRSIRTLVPLQHILAMVLAVGNYMNGNNRSGKAHGFKLDTLLKLKDIREKKTPQRNLLHFVLEQFPPSGEGSSVFYAHWKGMWRAAKTSKASIDGIVQHLRDTLEVCIAAIAAAEDIQDEGVRGNLVHRLGGYMCALT
jgi:hypothetical protein